MKKEIYKAYLRTPQWKAIRIEVINERGGKCERCGSTKRLEVHHKTYKNLFNESLSELELLCSSCHKAHHKVLSKKPIKRTGYKKQYANSVFRKMYS